MATLLRAHSTQTNGIGATYFDANNDGNTVSSTAVVNTAASGTDIKWTQTAGGALIKWVSGRVPAGGFTLAGLVEFQIWALESNMSANCGGRVRLYKRTAAGVETEIGGGPWNDGIEFGTTAAAMNWTGTPTSTAFLEDDRLIFEYAITNVGTMASGYTCTLQYGNFTNYDTYINIFETVAFKAEEVPAFGIIEDAAAYADKAPAWFKHDVPLGDWSQNVNAIGDGLVAGTGAVTALASIGGTATVAVNATGAVTASASIAGTATVAVAATGAVTAQASIAGTAAVAVAGTGAVTAQASIAGTAAVAVNATGAVTANASAAGTATVAVAATGAVTALASLAGSATVDVAGVGAVTASASLAGAAEVASSVTAVGAVTAAASLSGTAEVTGSGVAEAPILRSPVANYPTRWLRRPRDDDENEELAEEVAQVVARATDLAEDASRRAEVSAAAAINARLASAIAAEITAAEERRRLLNVQRQAEAMVARMERAIADEEEELLLLV